MGGSKENAARLLMLPTEWTVGLILLLLLTEKKHKPTKKPNQTNCKRKATIMTYPLECLFNQKKVTILLLLANVHY